MKEMIKKAKAERGGFTLAELLIVVAIVLVLAAIAIPIFMGALNNADTAVKNAQIASVKQAAVAEILTEGKTSEITGSITGWKAEAKVSATGDLEEVTITAQAVAADAESKATKNADNSYSVEVYLKPVDIKTGS